MNCTENLLVTRDAKMNGHRCEVSLVHLLEGIRRKIMIELSVSSSANKYKGKNKQSGRQISRAPLPGDQGRQIVPETLEYCMFNIRGLRRRVCTVGSCGPHLGVLMVKGQRLFPPNTLMIFNHFKQNRFQKK